MYKQHVEWWCYSSGKFDQATIQQMLKPRCGLQDKTPPGSKGSKFKHGGNYKIMDFVTVLSLMLGQQTSCTLKNQF